MGATIRDVARRAGVSISTVSRVLNKTARVSATKRALVLEAAEALGYAPNPAARSLLGKNTGGIGVLLPFVSGEFFAELLHTLDMAAQKHGFFLLISSSHRHRDEYEAAIQALERRVDGLVIMAPELRPEEAQALVQAEDPIVFINTQVETLPFDLINFENYAGVYALTEHLLELGHQAIALIKGPPGAHDAEQRLLGFRDALQDAGLSSMDALVLEGDYTQEAGFAATRALLEDGLRPTAIIASNDYCATGVLRALHEARLRVPDDVSVVGFDGVKSTQYTQPPLTTVRVPIGSVGQKAVEVLLARLGDDDGQDSPIRRVFPVELVVRGSTAAPAV